MVRWQLKSFQPCLSNIGFVELLLLFIVLKEAILYQADTTRRLGGTIFSVGVANFDLDQLTEIAGGSDQFVFQVCMF